MTKTELIKAMSKKTGIDKNTTEKVLESFADSVKKHISEGENIYLRGFGTFQNILRHQKNFHAAPGKWILIPEHYEVKLKYSNEVKDLVK